MNLEKKNKRKLKTILPNNGCYYKTLNTYKRAKSEKNNNLILDDYTLINIFSFLSDIYIRKKIQMTCKKFNALSKDDIIWKDRFFRRFKMYNVDIKAVKNLGMLNNSNLNIIKLPCANYIIPKNNFYRKYRDTCIKRCYECGASCYKNFRNMKIRTCSMHNLKNAPHLYISIRDSEYSMRFDFYRMLLGGISITRKCMFNQYIYKTAMLEYEEFLKSYNLQLEIESCNSEYYYNILND